MGRLATSPLPSRSSPTHQCGGQKRKWPTSGPSGYITPAVWGSPTLQSARGGGGGKWTSWLHHPCRPGVPKALKQVKKNRIGVKVGGLATSPLPPGRSRTRQSGRQKENWPTCGPIGHITPSIWGSPTPQSKVGDKKRCGPEVGRLATSRPWEGPQNFKARTKTELSHQWEDWQHHPYRLGGRQRFKQGGKFRSGPQVGRLATSPLLSGGSPTLLSGQRKQKWPTSGPSGYINFAVRGVRNASKRATKSEGVHNWANWLHHPCRLGGPQCFGAGDKISNCKFFMVFLDKPCIFFFFWKKG